MRELPTQALGHGGDVFVPDHTVQPEADHHPQILAGPHRLHQLLEHQLTAVTRDVVARVDKHGEYLRHGLLHLSLGHALLPLGLQGVKNRILWLRNKQTYM